jgi:hypothetical protein
MFIVMITMVIFIVVIGIMSVLISSVMAITCIPSVFHFTGSKGNECYANGQY